MSSQQPHDRLPHQQDGNKSHPKLTSCPPIKTKPTTKRRKVAKACLFCKRSHMTCDDSRPCSRCLKREIGHLCCDEPPSALERSNLLSSLSNNHQPETVFTNSHSSCSSTQLPSDLTPLINTSLISSDSSLLDSFNHPIHSLSHLTSLFSPRLLLSPSSSDSPLNHTLDQSLAVFRASNGIKLLDETGTTNDFSDHMETTLFESSKMTPEPRNEESLIDLNEFLNAYPGIFSDNNNQNHNTTSSHDNHRSLVSPNGMLDQITVSPAAIHYDQVLSNSNDALFNHHSLLNPQDPPHPQGPGHKEDRLEQIIRSSGLEPFDYIRSEREITDWIESKLPEPSKGKMLALWHESQNLFSTVANQQNPEDLIELEYQFRRNLITCFPILDTLPIPGCIWRRTGEIYKTNEQFNNLIGIHSFACGSVLSFLSCNKDPNYIKINQLWDIDSFLNFTEKFNRISLDEGQKAVLTSCVLYRFKEKEKVENRKEIENQASTSTPASLSSASSSSLSSPCEKDKVAESHQSKQENIHQTQGHKNGQEILNHDSLRSATIDDKILELNDSGKSLIICDRINCTFSFTVRRDSFGLPCLIIGNFLPS